MATEPTAKPAQGSTYATMGQPQHEAPDTASGRLSALSVDLGMPLEKGQTKAPIHKEPDHGLEVNIQDGAGTLKRVDTSKEGEPVKLGADGKPVVPTAAPDPNAAPVVPDPNAATQQAATVGLPKLEPFDAAKPETVEAYTKAFAGPEGKGVNMANLSADWQANAKVDPKTGAITGSLSEDTYKFLETQGLDRATIKAVEAGQVAQMVVQRNAVFQLAGGQEKYAAAINWAKAGGYDEAGRAKFNADLNAGGAAQKDAIDLLMQRHGAANPTRRQVSPTRTTADAGANPPAASGVQPYANYAAYQADLRKARATNDQALLDTSRARLKASTWHTGEK